MWMPDEGILVNDCSKRIKTGSTLRGPKHVDRTSVWWFNLPRVEIFCHDINVHILHHVSSRIRSYNLRAAHKSLQENWGKVVPEISQPITFLRRVMPDHA
ncbi:hypothetical protein M8C21_002080 [Ambrosia artemisiifolia]|uniref:Fatty acid desaturase domain-containing protein n=1 Tax=Ambrosia artemisiifolia TaxID=4212 RepID=A0AAD5DEL3_AMBAR|nr:hypothetical protein M8C21_002080 [Ambrosia artemisiifolia]